MNENISHVDILQNIDNNLFHVIITFIIDCKALYNLKNAINKTFQMFDQSRVSYYYYLFEHEKFMELFKKLEDCITGCQKLNTYLSRQIDRLKNSVVYCNLKSAVFPEISGGSDDLDIPRVVFTLRKYEYS
ncbi:Uncharacterized protein PCOAH_00019040 [Plasmodium coatneyi]|uniref:Uncharacterized protein n=1 Tax=Plasmodium coatneyi TaxID=208452 RepID=A0A1B1DXN9_9APIC|nr:Uncharacterized protein PCOAH_00019040 [Plasmodium coatneyi]ANQ07365.1 Uncharacterized protein PCOAH_00019040 [Plasmodium coatneyi]